ncbi:toxin 47 [Lachnospiraceae bacterium RM5]|nr:toxin 47 [Lachnospiraceae bacterium RM5]
MVVSLLLVLNFSIVVLASSNHDRQEADACITISGRLSVKGGSDFGNYQFKEGIDIDLRGEGTYKDALNIAFEKTGIPKEDFTITKWGKDKYGKSFPVEWRTKNGYEVNIDIGHYPDGNAPTVPHIGWQTAGKRGSGGGTRGHIFVDDVPYNR